MAASKKSDTQDRVWIELEHPATKEQGDRRAALVTNMLRRLGVERQRVWWSGHEGRYCYGDEMGYIVLADTGHWFNLEYFGRDPDAIRPVLQEEEDAKAFDTLRTKMQECGWSEVHDGDVTYLKHQRLGMEQPSYVDAIAACIEVASEA